MDQITESHCPDCFADKGRNNPCPHCGYDEGADYDPLILPHRTRLHGQFVVGRVLGKPSNFDITYLGWDPNLRTRVVIKEFLPRDLAARSSDRATVAAHSHNDDDQFRFGLEQFLREARALAQLDHPNIARVRHFFEANGTAYMVMDYYPGLSLAEYLDQQGGRIPEEQAKQLMLPILEGLQAVHAEGLLHGDIKPQNIYLVDLESGRPRPILVEFGAARQALAKRSGLLSAVLTPGYAAFEQYQRRGQQGAWTDIYGTAAVIYRLVTGEVPPAASEDAHEGDPRPASAFGVSSHLSDALAAGLALDPTGRPQTVQDFQALLWGEPLAMSPDPQPAARWWPAALAITMILLGLGGWGWLLFFRSDLPTAETPRDDEAALLAAAQTAAQRQGADDRAFAVARGADTDRAYQSYLDNCTSDSCGYRSEAEQRLQELAEEDRKRQADLTNSRNAEAAALAAAQAAAQRQSADDLAFAIASGTDTELAYHSYLDNCVAGSCRHWSEAEQRLLELAFDRVHQSDLADYAATERAGTVAAFRTYLANCAAKGCAKRAQAQANLDRLLQLPALVRIEAGSFSMGCKPSEQGCDPDEQDDQKRPHQVQVNAFEIGKYEVTLAQFRAFVHATGYRTEAELGDGCYGWKSDILSKHNTYSWRNAGFPQHDDSPVVCVSWNDAKRYVAWLTEETGQTWRLPTEAEWEYAARAGTQTPYSTGQCISTDQANYNGEADSNLCRAKTSVDLMRTQPVGSYPANPWGLYDMHGNVWEWVQDCYHSNYTGAPTDGRAWGTPPCSGRVQRGGSWYGDAKFQRSSNRYQDEASSRYHTLGFRVARTPTT